jgi:DNA-binding transcriptional MerR regulator
MAELLSIGAFSRMTFLTVKALRHYHDEGLLAPASVDPHSGYRYYRPEQVPTARLIRRLRELDLPVDEVRAVLAAPDEERRNEVIVAHLDRMSRQLQETQETVDSLRRLLSGGVDDLEVAERDEPPVTTMAIRQSVSGDDALAWWLDAFAELHRAVRVGGLVRSGPDGALFPTKFFTEGVAELVVFVPVEAAGTPSGRVEAYELPAARLAVTTYDGPMIDLDSAYTAVGRAVLERSRSADGPVRERYLPLGEEDDLLHHRTEVGWPCARDPDLGRIVGRPSI